jgi:hypothetical protein
MQPPMFKWLLFCTGFNTLVITINHYGIRRINDYIDVIEERNGNKKLNEIKQSLDNMIKDTDIILNK